MERIMAVYDVDPFYADRFAEFANQKERVPFTVMAFTSLERLRNYARENPIELLLIDAGVRKEAADIRAGKVVALSEGESIRLEKECPSVYKYQPTDSIIREVMECYCEDGGDEVAHTGKKARVLGVYSPVGRCLKTSFALTMGQLLGKDSKVLYLNLEECSGFSKLIPTETKGNLSDIFYYYQQGSLNHIRMKSMIYSWNNLDYIPPVGYPDDWKLISPDHINGIIEKIARESGYEEIIVDIGQIGRKGTELLRICDVIYMPVKEDWVSAAKIQEFEEYLDIAGLSSVKEKLYKMKLPYHNHMGKKEDYMEQLIWGELGDYVRKLLRGRG